MKTSFRKLHGKRRAFLRDNCNKSFVVEDGLNNVLISAPHGVLQVRLGRFKFSEVGSLAVALQLADETGSFLIAKTKNCGDDANFDEVSDYKKMCFNLIEKHNIKYVIDLHGLAHNRGVDVNLGTHIGKNVENSPELLCKLQNMLSQEFSVLIDNPFMGGANTISGSCKSAFPKLWTIQIEIDCHLTNKKENEKRLLKLLEILWQFVKELP